MTARIFIIICVLIICVRAFALPAPARAERAVGMQEAIGIAMRNNHGLRAAGESLLASREGIGAARSRLLPRVTFEERYMRTDNPTFAFSSKLNQGRFGMSDFAIDTLNSPEDIDDFQTTLSFEQPVFAREAWVGLAMSKKEAEAAGFDRERTREKTVLEVIRAYLNVRTAREFLGAAEKGLEDALEHKRIAAARFDAGLGLYSDTLRTEVSHKEAEERLLRAKRILNVSKRALGLALGLEESVDAMSDGPDPELLGLDEYTRIGLGRSDINALGARLANARNTVRLAEAKYMPLVGVGGSYQWNDHQAPFGAEGESYQVSAFLRWSIFDGTLRSHERAGAKHRLREAQEHLGGLKKQVMFGVYSAYLGVEEAKKSLELELSRETLAEESARLVEVRYENALSTVVELLDAQAALDTARAGVVKMRNNYRVALAELNFQSGTIIENYGEAQSP
jgi:outer membrane protein TolC